MQDAERRAEHLRMAGEGLSQREIAKRTGASQTTVSRDLRSLGKEPVGVTPGGAAVYPPGRFEGVAEFDERVDQLVRDMPRLNARGLAARELAGPAPVVGMRRQVVRLRSAAEKERILERFGRIGS
jgi:predicted transcriptional regulator